MDRIHLYNVSFTDCPAGPADSYISEKIITVRTACVPEGNNSTSTECARYFPKGRDCEDKTVYAIKKMLLGGGWQQCYVECSVTYPNAIVSPTPISTEINNRPPNTAVTAYPTFIITFAALLFTLFLTSKRSH